MLQPVAGSQFAAEFQPVAGGLVVQSQVFSPVGPGAPSWTKELEKPVVVMAGETVATFTSSNCVEDPPEYSPKPVPPAAGLEVGKVPLTSQDGWPDEVTWPVAW